MNAMQYALNRVYATIPRPILEEAFEPSKHFTSLDDRIREEVICGRVLPDCNLFAGKVTRIVLQENWAEYTTIPPMVGIITTGDYTVYRIPAKERDNKKIVSVTSLEYPPQYYSGNMITYNGYNLTGSTAGDLACQVITSVSGAGTLYHPTPILKEGNLVYVYPPQSAHIDWILVCRLAYDDEYSNINDSAIMPLARLIECATKIFIYNTLVLKIDAVRIEGGYEMSKFRDIVESYQDQFDKYDELLMEFRGGALLDPERMARIVTMAL